MKHARKRKNGNYVEKEGQLYIQKVTERDNCVNAHRENVNQQDCALCARHLIKHASDKAKIIEHFRFFFACKKQSDPK